MYKMMRPDGGCRGIYGNSMMMVYLWLLFCLLLLATPAVMGVVAAGVAPATAVEGSQVQEETTLHWYEVCTQRNVKELPFCDISLDLDIRVDDYVSRIPVEQQIKMMGNTAQPYEELHIPSYQWWNEGLHGAKITPCITLPKSDGDGEKDGESDDSITYCPTSFPCPSGLGNAFNVTLYGQIAKVISKEALAFSEYRRNTDSTNNKQHGDGLTLWAPTINLQRDPRWGRNQEVPGEDPYLTSQYAHAFVTGLQEYQGQDDSSLEAPRRSPESRNKYQIAAGCKHFIANSLESWNNHTRHNFNAMIPAVDLYNYYIPPFESCVKHANSLGIMCSYNAVNGHPSCENQWLLKDLLRDTWNFTGYVVTDCGALDDFIHGHHIAVDDIQASAFGINATVDVNCGNVYYNPNYNSNNINDNANGSKEHRGGLLDALDQGIIQNKSVKESFTRLARVQFRLGLFDNNAFSDNNSDAAPIIPDVAKLIDTPEHQQLAYEAALQSIVLLENRNNTLPLEASGGEKIAVIGPHSLSRRELLSNYHGQRCPGSSSSDSDDVNCFEHKFHDYDECFTCITTPYDAIRDISGEYDNVKYKLGCHVSDTKFNEIDDAVALASQSDTIIMMMGLDQSQEQEGRDRYITTLPGLQTTLLKQVIDAVTNDANKKLVLVLIHGGSISLGEDIIAAIPAIVTASYGGQNGSKAIADVLFGNYNPVGKLSSMMYPPNYVNGIPLTDMSLYGNGGRHGTGASSSHPGRTYQYYPEEDVEFPFGHGLSYSDWQIQWDWNSQIDDRSISPLSMKLPMASKHLLSSARLDSYKQVNLPISIELQNSGPLAGSQTVLLFWEPKDIMLPTGGAAGVTLPNRRLIRFDCSELMDVGATYTISWNLTLHDFVVWYNINDDPYDVSNMTPTVFVGTYQLRALTANQETIVKDIVIHEGMMSSSSSSGNSNSKSSLYHQEESDEAANPLPSSSLRTTRS